MPALRSLPPGPPAVLPSYDDGGIVPASPPAPQSVGAFATGGQIPALANGGFSTGGNPQTFVRVYYPYAKAWEQRTGIPAAVFLGIGASESNWGNAGSIFGIKGVGPGGGSQQYATWEYVNGRRVDTTAAFATYRDPNEAFAHFVGLVSSGRYAPAWAQFQRDRNPAGFLANLQRAQYATDPRWPANVMNLAAQADAIAGQTGVKALPPAQVQQRMSQGQYPSLPSTGTGGAAMSSPTQTQTPISDSAIDTYMNSLADAINARQRDIAQLDARIAGWDESKDGPRVGDVNPQTGTRTRTAYDNLVERRDTLASQQTQDVSAYQRTASAQGRARTPDDVSKLLAARADQVRANAAVTSAGASVVDANARAGAVGVNIAELPFGQANAQAALGSASAALANANANAGRTSGDLLTSLTGAIHTFAGDDVALGKYMDDIVASAFTRAYNGALLQLKRGELSTAAFSNVVTAIAARTTAEAAWAMRSLAEAQYVSEENWKRAERLLPANTQYMPGMGPNDERAQAMRKLGITPTVQQAVPLPADWNDPWANLRQADAQRQQLGQQRPGEAFAPAIAGQQAVAGDLYRDYQTPWTFTPPQGFETPLAVQPWPGRDQLVRDWTSEFQQFAASSNYDTGMPAAPGYTAPPPVAGYDPEAFDDDGTPLTEEEKQRRRAARANPPAPAPVPDLTPPPTPPVPTPGSNGAMAHGGMIDGYSLGGRYGAPPVRPVFPVYGGYAA